MLSHLLISFPPGRGGGRARGAERRVRVCDCDKGPLGFVFYRRVSILQAGSAAAAREAAREAGSVAEAREAAREAERAGARRQHPTAH